MTVAIAVFVSVLAVVPAAAQDRAPAEGSVDTAPGEVTRAGQFCPRSHSDPPVSMVVQRPDSNAGCDSIRPARQQKQFSRDAIARGRGQAAILPSGVSRLGTRRLVTAPAIAAALVVGPDVVSPEATGLEATDPTAVSPVVLGSKAGRLQAARVADIYPEVADLFAPETSAAAPFTSPLNFDLAVADAIRGSGLQQNRGAKAIAGVFRLASLPGTLLLAATLYGVGTLEGNSDISDLGLDAGRAVVGAGLVTVAGKFAAGRARPRVSPDDPTDFSAGGGFRGDDYQAFPSAHAAAAFAAATVLATSLADRHPGSSGWIQPPIYAAAAMAGLSRLFDEEHWTTDILAGGLIGVLAGLYVNERYDRVPSP